MSKTTKRVLLILAAVVLALAALAWAGWRALMHAVESQSPIIDDPKVQAIAGEGFPGYWEGTLNVMGVQELRMQLHIEKDAGGKLKGSAVSPDQSPKAMPLTTCVEKGSRVEFAIKSVGGSFKGEFNADSSRLTGHWKQNGTSLPLLLKRQPGPPAPPARPQVPQKPYPYIEYEIGFPSGGGTGATLAGTLSIPGGEGPFPAVVLIAGSGPLDRDEAVFGHRPFLVLSDWLVRNGIAVLRYDKRGIGKSAGVFAAATPQDFAADAAAAFAFMKSRPEIDPARIGLCGHSEGASEAFMVAAGASDVAFVVSLAGAGVRMDALLERQREDLIRATPGARQNAKTETLTRKAVAIAREQGDTPAARAEVKEIFADMGLKGDAAKPHIAQTFSPWMIAFLRYDPLPTLAKVKCHVLALNGEKDTQVAASANLPALKNGIESGGNKQVTTRELPGLNHLFQNCKTGAPAEYPKIEETFDPKTLEIISTWILETLRK